MIPAWNSEQFLAETLDSVLAAGLAAGAQIEVVDDGSSDSTPQIVAAYARRGVHHHRNDRQLGATANFNQCVRRARGHYVHVLHADDRVLPGFYAALEQAFMESECLAAFCRSDYIDATGTVFTTTRSEAATGSWSDALATLSISNRIRPPAIAVRRSAYETVGGYREDLHHAADWEMWVRLARNGPLWFENAVHAQYRVHSEQDTSTHLLTAANITERVEALEMIVGDLPHERVKSAMRRGLLYSAAFAARTAWRLATSGEWSGAAAQTRAALRCGLAGLIASPGLARRGVRASSQVGPS